MSIEQQVTFLAQQLSSKLLKYETKQNTRQTTAQLTSEGASAALECHLPRERIAASLLRLQLFRWTRKCISPQQQHSRQMYLHYRRSWIFTQRTAHSMDLHYWQSWLNAPSLPAVLNIHTTIHSSLNISLKTQPHLQQHTHCVWINRRPLWNIYNTTLQKPSFISRIPPLLRL